MYFNHHHHVYVSHNVTRKVINKGEETQPFIFGES